MSKRVLINIFVALLFIVGIGLIGYNFYQNYQQENAGKPIPKAQIKKTTYTSFDKYDFINLDSINISSTSVDSNKVLHIKYDSNFGTNLKFSLIDVYTNKTVLDVDSKNSEFEINYDKVKNLTSRYDVLTKVKNKVFKLSRSNVDNTQMDLNNGFGLINNGGFELSFNKIVVDFDKEFDLFVNDVNYYRKSIGASELKYERSINNLSKVRASDEVKAKTYNFHYSTTTGYSNGALVAKGVVSSDNCSKDIKIETNTYCNIKFKDKSFSVNAHGNNFEQITRGILFAHQNIIALKASQIHNADLVSTSKNYIGGSIQGTNKSLLLKKDIITMFGPTQDHTIDQASGAYINGDFTQGIKKPDQQEKIKVKFLNSALSLYTF